jgi:hypothetical protein
VPQEVARPRQRLQQVGAFTGQGARGHGHPPFLWVSPTFDPR